MSDPESRPLADEQSRPAPMDAAPVAVPFARPVLANGNGLAPAVIYASPLAPPVRKPMPWWRALLEAAAPLAAAMGGSTFAVPVVVLLHPADERWFTVAATITGGLAAVATCAVLLRLESRPPTSIGLTGRRPVLNLLIGVWAYMLAAMGLFVLGVIALILFPQLAQHENDATKAIQATFPPMRAASMILFMSFVAVWEEIAFRGFMLTRLQVVFRRWWVTIPVGAVAFALGHGYEGSLAMVQTFLLGLALGVLFWWRRSLLPCTVFHALNNVVAFLVLNGL